MCCGRRTIICGCWKKIWHEKKVSIQRSMLLHRHLFAGNQPDLDVYRCLYQRLPLDANAYVRTQRPSPVANADVGAQRLPLAANIYDRIQRFLPAANVYVRTQRSPLAANVYVRAQRSPLAVNACVRTQRSPSAANDRISSPPACRTYRS